MAPTAVFKTAKSREPTGPNFTASACFSVRSTASDPDRVSGAAMDEVVSVRSARLPVSPTNPLRHASVAAPIATKTKTSIRERLDRFLK
jgi:hypothetical protein